MPETRLRVNVPDLFQGKLDGFAQNKVEAAIQLQVYTKESEKKIRITNVTTFDISETHSFTGLTLQKTPRMKKNDSLKSDKDTPSPKLDIAKTQNFV